VLKDEPMLPEPLPEDPFPLFRAWFDEAVHSTSTPNPNAMCVATADSSGRPSARIVLCKLMDLERGYVVFFTNYESRKGRELGENAFAEAVFHWDAQGRQVRLSGPVLRSPAAESDEYFQSRPRESRIGAWASCQSQPVASRADLIGRFEAAASRFGEGEVLRPPHWGGNRLWPERMELWVSGDARIHDRAVWTREVTSPGGNDEPVVTGPWSATRLQP
jgi:pyridoxamine 5'-phosphate oxidase